MAKIDHTNCDHPRTPAGRRACRAGNAVAQPDTYIADHLRKTAAAARIKQTMDRRYDEIKMTGAAARKLARHAAAADKVRAPRQATAAPRIQPRRVPVRGENGSCIQAALHTGGRCACGYHEASFCVPEVWACAGH